MVASGNVGLAFAMVFGAGAASSLGAAVVFCVRLASTRLLSAGLGFAAGEGVVGESAALHRRTVACFSSSVAPPCCAGVMLYVVFAEIFSKKSVGEFQAAGYSGEPMLQWSSSVASVVIPAPKPPGP